MEGVAGDSGGIPPEFLDNVRRIARGAKFKWPKLWDTDQCDVETAIWEYLFARPNQIRKLVNMPPDNQRQTLAWIANRALSESYEDFKRYAGHNLYTHAEVVQALSSGMLYQTTLGGNWLEGFIFEALDKLVERDKIRDEHGRGAAGYAQTIWDRYGPGGKAPAQGAQAQHLTDALERLVIEVNKAQRRYQSSREGPAKRRSR